MNHLFRILVINTKKPWRTGKGSWLPKSSQGELFKKNTGCKNLQVCPLDFQIKMSWQKHHDSLHFKKKKTSRFTEDLKKELRHSISDSTQEPNKHSQRAKFLMDTLQNIHRRFLICILHLSLQPCYHLQPCYASLNPVTLTISYIIFLNV